MKDNQYRLIADLREAFKALSADALKQTQPEFLRLANETLCDRLHVGDKTVGSDAGHECDTE